MPRINIRRDQTGGPVQPALPGGVSTVVIAHVSYPAGLQASVDSYPNQIWSTATGGTALHTSKKVQNFPAGAIGYIHIYGDNALIAVSRLDVAAGTIELVGSEGRVNGGMHVF
jgi:hypothetical protein